MKSPLPFNLASVSSQRVRFLSEWRRERRIDCTVQEMLAAGPNSRKPAPGTKRRTKPAQPLQWRAYDGKVVAGDVRLLAPEFITDLYRAAYAAVLDVDHRQGIGLVATFSPYSNPATKDEWLTGIKSHPLRVLQLWNTLPVPFFALARSWCCCKLTKKELSTARELYRHAIAGTWPSAALREQVGLAIHDPGDDRLVYQEAEMALYAPLREAFFNVLTAREEETAAPIRNAIVLPWAATDQQTGFALAAAGLTYAPAHSATYTVGKHGVTLRVSLDCDGKHCSFEVLGPDDRLSSKLDGSVVVTQTATSQPFTEGQARMSGKPLATGFRVRLKNGTFVALRKKTQK